MSKTTTMYVLRIRCLDSAPWGEPEFYRTRKERDRVEKANRILGGIRTWSYSEKFPVDEAPEPTEAAR